MAALVDKEHAIDRSSVADVVSCFPSEIVRPQTKGAGWGMLGVDGGTYACLEGKAF